MSIYKKKHLLWRRNLKPKRQYTFEHYEKESAYRVSAPPRFRKHTLGSHQYPFRIATMVCRPSKQDRKNILLQMGQNGNPYRRPYQFAYRFVRKVPLEGRDRPLLFRTENQLQRTDQRPFAGSDRLRRKRGGRRCTQPVGFANRTTEKNLRRITFKNMQNIPCIIFFYATFAIR